MLAAFTVGLVVCLWMLQNNPAIKQSISRHLLTFLENEWNTRISVANTKINFFTCSLYLETGALESKDHRNYRWGFEQCKIYISPWQLLWNKKVCLDLAFNNLKGHSAFSLQHIDVVDHLFDIFTPKSPDLDIEVSSLALHNIDLELVRQDEIYELHAPGSLTLTCDTKPKSKPHWKGLLALHKASIFRNNKPFAHSISGSVGLDRDTTTEIWSYTPLLECASPLLNPTSTYTVQGMWNAAQQTVTLRDSSNEIELTGTLSNKTNVQVKGSFPISLFYTLCTQKTPDASPVQGTCSANLTFAYQDDTISTDGSLTLRDARTNSAYLPNLEITFNATHTEHEHLHGLCTWNIATNSGSLTLKNSASLAPLRISDNMPYIAIHAGDIDTNLTFNNSGSIAGTYACTLTNPTTERRHTYSGTVAITQKSIDVEGKTQRGSYVLQASLEPHLYLTKWHYTVGDKSLINFVSDSHNPFLLKGQCEWSLLRSFLHQQTRRLLFGTECSFAVTLDQSNETIKTGSCSLHHGTFYIPELHNLIHTFSTNFTADLESKKFTLSDVIINFSKGSAVCQKATVALDAQYNLQLVHIPLQIDDLFINWKKDFYGSVHGNLLLNKLPEHDTLLAGILILKKALIKESFFSKSESSTLTEPISGSLSRYPFPCILHVKLMTEKPIKAQMANIDANASFNLMLMATPNKEYGTVPYITGSISLTDGTLKILNNKLAIERGKIQFIKNQLHDPIIELTAKNRINKYLVNLHVTGSLEKPNIILESTPDLTEEQIVGLLLAGSEHATLQSDLPSMLLQNLDALIFNNKKRTKTTAIFDGLTKTFKYVQITPNLTDSSGKQGLMKGSLSLNLSDQLRAQVHKNLTTQRNDFSAQLEYFLSDNINIKVIQDQRDKRAESGAEIEMRFSL